MTDTTTQDWSPQHSGSTGGQSTTEQVKEQVKEKAGAQVSTLREKASEQTRSQVQARASQAAEQARGLASSARTVADDLEEKGSAPVANVVRQVADRGDKVADYFEGADADRILRDLENQARQRPWAAAAAAFVLGLAASRVLKASSQRRSEDSQRQLTTGSVSSYGATGYSSGDAYGSSYGTAGTAAVGTAGTYGTDTGSYDDGLGAVSEDTLSNPSVTGVTGAGSLSDTPGRGL
jgi:hypothetical protein